MFIVYPHPHPVSSIAYPASRIPYRVSVSRIPHRVSRIAYPVFPAILNFAAMQLANVSGILVEKTFIASGLLQRDVTVDLFLPPHIKELSSISLLLLNDGQHMEEMEFASM